MLFADPTELRATSRLPAIPGLVECPDLEAHTGADLLVSPLENIPAATPTLIARHIAAGAVLVQRKSGLDLVHSLGERLNAALARMRETSAQAGQCVLLFAGQLDRAAGGLATVDGRETSADYWAVRMALSAWTHRGGVVEHLAGDHEIPEWCRRIEQHLREYRQRPLKLLYPTPEYPPDPPDPLDPLQLLVPVRDGRLLLAAFRGIGPARADALWKAAGGNLAAALALLTDETSPKRLKVPGVDVATIRAVREQCGLRTGELIGAVAAAEPEPETRSKSQSKPHPSSTQSTLFDPGVQPYA